MKREEILAVYEQVPEAIVQLVTSVFQIIEELKKKLASGMRKRFQGWRIDWQRIATIAVNRLQPMDFARLRQA